MKLLNLMMRMSDADDQEVSIAEPGDKTPRFDQAKAALAAEERRSTQAEIRAAHEAARRHGYS
jgi:hypothetical protein